VKMGDVVTVIEHIPPREATDEHQADSGFYKIQTDDGRVGWIQGMYAEPVTEH
jgi:hypothetical protein